MIDLETNDRRGNGGADDPDGLQRLLRSVHIFSSTVNEIIEKRYLQQATHSPINLSQLHLLKLISLNGDHFVGQVAEFLGVSAPAASKTVDKLVRLGFLERATPETDRRASALHITEAGRAVVREYDYRRVAGLQPVLAAFEAEDLVQLTELLERFSTALLSAEDEGDPACLRCGAYYEEVCPVRTTRGYCPYEQVRRAATAR